jgi:hypothetical protein
LGDVTSWAFDITGSLNNLKAVYGNPSPETDPTNPMNWNLMREQGNGRRTDSNGQWLNLMQCNQIYSSAQTHPAYYYSD